MPVYRQKKLTTTYSSQEQPATGPPEQQTFQQYLRELARGTIRVLLETVMRKELNALIGVGWGEFQQMLSAWSTVADRQH